MARFPWDLSPQQQELRLKMIAAAEPFRDSPWTIEGYRIGTLVQPAHLESGFTIPEQRYTVRYSPGYGIISNGLCTSNGSALMIALCVTDDTLWKPALMLLQSECEAD